MTKSKMSLKQQPSVHNIIFQCRLTQNGAVAITKEPMMHLVRLETGALLGSSLESSSLLL